MTGTVLCNLECRHYCHFSHYLKCHLLFNISLAPTMVANHRCFATGAPLFLSPFRDFAETDGSFAGGGAREHLRYVALSSLCFFRVKMSSVYCLDT